jgi:type III restriction enzyme
LEDLDDPLKIKRLRQWCRDVNDAHGNVHFDFVYVDQESFDQFTEDGGKFRGQLKSFSDLVIRFRAYKDDGV